MEKKNKNFLKLMFRMFAIGILGGFVANGVFWLYQQNTPYTISFSIMVGSFLATWIGYIIRGYEYVIRGYEYGRKR